MIDNEIINFIMSIIINDPNTKYPITTTEAAYNLYYMKSDGIEIPNKLTPAVFTTLYNELINNFQ